MREDDEQASGDSSPEGKQPRRMLELDTEHSWYGTVFGITLGLLALWALST